MDNKGYISNILVLSISALILEFGCSLFVTSSFGADSMTTLLEGMTEVFKINLSTANILLNLIMVFIAYVLDKKQIGIGSIIYPIVCSIGISIGFNIIHTIAGWLRFIGFIAALFCLSYAIALASITKCGRNPYDALCFAIIEKVGIEYNKIRMLLDAFMLILGILLGGSYGVGTIISIFVIGNLAMLFMKNIEQIVWLKDKLNIGGTV